jgi:hypothetical protein
MENNSNDIHTNKNILSDQSNIGTNSQVNNLHFIPIMNNTRIEYSKLSGYTMFCREQMIKAREEGKITLVDCANAWKNTDESTKANYDILAEEVNKEKEKIKDPCGTRPVGPYNYFLMDLNKRNIFTGLADAAESWKNLSEEDEKSKYITQAEQDQQAYNTKNNNISTAYSKPIKSAFNFFVADQKDYPQGGFFSWCYEKEGKQKTHSKEEKCATRSLTTSKRLKVVSNHIIKMQTSKQEYLKTLIKMQVPSKGKQIARKNIIKRLTRTK